MAVAGAVAAAVGSYHFKTKSLNKDNFPTNQKNKNLPPAAATATTLSLPLPQ